MVRGWVGDLPRETYDVPSVLEGWTVGDLVAHLGRGIGVLADVPRAGDGVRPLSLSAYVSAYPAAGPAIAESTRNDAREATADPLGALDAAWLRVEAARDDVLASPEGKTGDLVVVAPRGPLTLSDLVLTRLIELVVHTDDLHRSLPDLPMPAIPRDPQRLVVRALLDVLVERAPGRSVEVRIPPFAAVQCVEGPRHTRGTPPNVVEASPTTWIRLACGRTSWVEAVADGSARASGERADLSGLLPLL